MAEWRDDRAAAAYRLAIIRRSVGRKILALRTDEYTRFERAMPPQWKRTHPDHNGPHLLWRGCIITPNGG